jgi:hypothetical protein
VSASIITQTAKLTVSGTTRWPIVFALLGLVGMYFRRE